MKNFLANFIIDLLTAWTIVGCGAIAIQHDTAFWVRIILWFVVFVGLDFYVYIKNKINY